MEELKKNIDPNKLPQHVAVIMDGNGRWAKQKKQPRVFGHKNALNAVRETVEGAAEIGVKYLTLYAFSTENWNRPKLEVKALMELLIHAISSEVKTLNKNDIKLAAIGDLSSLPKRAQKELQEAIDNTANNKRMTLVLALSYSAQWEMIEAVKVIASKTKSGEISIDDIDSNMFSNHLSTQGMPNPELMIRTSGEHRISNFLLWQLAYAELYFTEKLWPDFRKEDLFEAILNFQNRERRFGLTGEQVAKTEKN
jgi:undecaprenyl diphosphate synthase